ncbi:MAG: DUF502 domain-containing protein [Acuticoccus sp.]
MLKSTLVGGVFFLIPLAVVAIVLGKVLELANKVAAPLGRVVPIDRVVGIAMADILAVVLIVAVCVLAGITARLRFFSDRIVRLDNALIDIVPRYAVAKSTLSGITNVEQAALSAVLVRFDDCEQIAFEVERSADKVVLFLPGAPSPWSGTSVIVDAERVTPVNLPTHQVVGLLRVLGRGTLPVIKSDTPEAAAAPR